MQWKIKNLDKSHLDRQFLKAIVLGAQTIFSGKEFQREISRYAKEPSLICANSIWEMGSIKVERVSAR